MASHYRWQFENSSSFKSTFSNKDVCVILKDANFEKCDTWQQKSPISWGTRTNAMWPSCKVFTYFCCHNSMKFVFLSQLYRFLWLQLMLLHPMNAPFQMIWRKRELSCKKKYWRQGAMRKNSFDQFKKYPSSSSAKTPHYAMAQSLAVRFKSR